MNYLGLFNELLQNRKLYRILGKNIKPFFFYLSKLMGSIVGSLKPIVGNLVISSPGFPPNWLNIFSKSALSSFSISGDGSTNFPPL